MGNIYGRDSRNIEVKYEMKEKMFFIKTILICCFIVFMAYMLMNVQPDSPTDISEVEKG